MDREKVKERDRVEIEIRDIDGIVEELGTQQRSVIPILQAIQEKYNYLPEEALRRVCEISDITPGQIVGVASFYSQFSFTPAGTAYDQGVCGNCLSCERCRTGV